MKILINTFDYRPGLGGVATCSYNVAKAFSLNHNKVLCLAPKNKESHSFDSKQSFKTKRVWLPTRAFLAVPLISIHLLLTCIFFKPKIIINFLWMPESLACLLIKPILILLGIKTYTYAHAVEVIESQATLKKRIRSYLSPLKRITFLSSHKVFAVSEFTKSMLVKRVKIPTSKIKVVLNGVDTKTFYPKEVSKRFQEQYNPHNAFCMGTITRLEDYKGVDTFIEALSLFPETHRDFVYLVGGIGPDQERLKELVRLKKLEKNVFIVGKVADSELVDFYNLLDLHVLLTRDDWQTPNVEGFGLVFLEAAACGVTSLAADSGGISSAVISNKTGLLVNPEKVNDIVQSVIRLKSDHELLERLASNAFTFATKEMTWAHVIERIKGAL